MTEPQGEESFSPYQTPLYLKILIFPIGLIYQLWVHSVRLKYSSEKGKDAVLKLDQPMTLVLWHNRLFLAGIWERKFRKGRECYGLISASKDGAWLETFYGWVGIRAVRGSRNHRGSQSIRELIKKVRLGHDVGITPDGSRGPKYQAKPGAIFVARASKSPIVLLSFTYTWCIRLNSWDQFVIPLPFSKVEAETRLLTYEELFAVKNNDEVTRIIQSSLLEITHD